MNYFEEWNAHLADDTDPKASAAFMEHYYKLETEAYDRIFKGHPQIVSGPAAELAENLGFGDDMVVFSGFLDGVRTSLKNAPILESVDDKTEITLDIDFEKLLWNMNEAKAGWLVGLDSWENVLPADRRRQIGKDFRSAHIAVRDRPGRNDPCPCGSGKKYKICCGRNG